MDSSWITSAKLVLRAALLVLLTGCGVVTGKAPLPVSTNPSSDAVAVAPGGLQLGYVWQADKHNLYPILGVTGATHYGSTALSADAVNAAAMATPSSSWALALTSDGSLREWVFPASTTNTLAANVALDASLMFSPSGTSALVVSPSTQNALVIGGLPLKPQVAAIALPSGFVAGAIAVSDSGALLVGVKQAAGAGIQIGSLSETHSYSAIGAMQAWGGGTFLPGNAADAAIMVDGISGQLTYIANPGGTSPALTPVPGGGLVQKAAGIGISPDGKFAFVADGAKPQLVRISLQSSGPAPSVIPCACTPQQMVPLTPDGIYSITRNVPGKPDWILDARTEQPRAFFIPAIPASNQTLAASTMQQSDRTSR